MEAKLRCCPICGQKVQMVKMVNDVSAKAVCSCCGLQTGLIQKGIEPIEVSVEKAWNHSIYDESISKAKSEIEELKHKNSMLEIENDEMIKCIETLYELSPVMCRQMPKVQEIIERKQLKYNKEYSLKKWLEANWRFENPRLKKKKEKSRWGFVSI